MSDKANYGGGKKGNLHEGLKTHNPPAEDKSRPAIGSKYSHVDTDACRKEVGKGATDAGPGPRTA